MLSLTASELRLLHRLSTPAKVQDFVNAIPFNFADTCLSPRMVLRRNTAHCMEGALFAALALRVQGHPPLVVDLDVGRGDDAHVIAVYRYRGHWGAISKTNHAVLRYRDPVYRSIRELVMSYFHEYSDKKGHKTLRSYTRPIDLRRFDRINWMTSTKGVEEIHDFLADATHLPVLPSPAMIKRLRRTDAIERKVGEIVEWKKSRPRTT